MTFDPPEIRVLLSALDAAWAALAPSQREAMPKTALAFRILRRAGEGERDPRKLTDYALQKVNS